MKPALLVLEPLTDQEIGSLMLFVDSQIEFIKKQNELGFYSPWIEYYVGIHRKLTHMRHNK
jgi:hypothetical protein